MLSIPFNPFPDSVILCCEAASKRLYGGIDLNNRRNAYKYGSLPENAPLAMAYVPMQKSVSPSYDTCEALSRGTLFPGLDLPFMNIVNKSI